jgi:hypothetical protein
VGALTCGGAPGLLEAAGTLKRADFAETLQEDLEPVLKIIEQRCREKSGSMKPGASES